MNDNSQHHNIAHKNSGGGFVSTVNVPQCKPVTGPVGNSKKEAEQFAAMVALRQLKIDCQ